MYDAIVVGCGLSGATVARYLAEKLNRKVLLLERRNHIGGNMYDYREAHGILVHKYGPHTFHTKKRKLYEYVCQYAEWEKYILTCGAVIDGRYTPTPFNFQTVDDFFEAKQAEKIKDAIRREYAGQNSATILDMLNHQNCFIRQYATFLFEKDYSLYTAKQWGISPQEIDPSVLKRVPVRFSYDIGYFDDEYQFLPKISYTDFFVKLLKHPNIEICLNYDFLEHVDLQEGTILFEKKRFNGMIIYTGAIDELFDCKYGRLPYRSLRFEWKTNDIKSFQEAPVVAYPQADGYTRITEYTKLPVQDVGEITGYAVEYPLPYKRGVKMEPYYPVLTEESKQMYNIYKKEAQRFSNLHLCGRLADFKYYNMDEALENALGLCERLVKY